MKSNWSEIFFTVLIVLALLFSNKICEARYFDSEILRDIKGVRVQISLSEDEAKILTIDRDLLKIVIESRLEKLGVNLYEKDTTEFFMTGRPEINVKISPINIRNLQSIDFYVETSFILTVRSFTNTKVTNRVPITYRHDFKCNGSIQDIFDMIDNHIDLISKSICSPRKGNICRNINN